MEQKPFDYRKADDVWRRMAPGENPYPEVRRGDVPAASPSLTGNFCQQLLRQELRHASELLATLEKGLAQFQ